MNTGSIQYYQYVLRTMLQYYTQPLSAEEYIPAPTQYKRVTDVTNAPMQVIKADDGVKVQLHSLSISALFVGERSASSLCHFFSKIH
jgi:hypothetical protein